MQNLYMQSPVSLLLSEEVMYPKLLPKISGVRLVSPEMEAFLALHCAILLQLLLT